MLFSAQFETRRRSYTLRRAASGGFADLSHRRWRPDWLAGAPGLEPGNGGIKIRCLTTWLRPNARAFRPI